MIKELKYLFFVIIITIFISVTLKYYFSDSNKKNSFRLLKQINEKIQNFSNKIILLEDNTSNAVTYVEKTIDKNKKNYNFWSLINNNE